MADTRLKDRSLFDPEIMRPAIWESFRKLAPQHVIKNPVTNGWRLVFQVRPSDETTEMRAFLDLGGETLTETWSYAAHP